MRFRLWHVFALMGLILVAGVLSVQQLEAHVGRTTVPGLLIIDAPRMDAAMADAAARRWPGAQLQWAPAGSAPLSPCDPAIVRKLRARGHSSALLAPRAADATDADDAVLHEAWGVLVSGASPDQAASQLAACVQDCDGVRPFVFGLRLPAPTTPELIADVGRLLSAAETLPSFRRTTVLVLGAREPSTHRRLIVRIDRGEVGHRPPPALAALLAGSP
jgi:hypothetical protein